MITIKNNIKSQISKYSLEIIIALVLIIIVILFYNVYITNKIYNDLYEGLWIADEDFCSKSQIDGLMIYIGPVYKSISGLDPRSQERKSYLIMYSNDSVIANKKINIVLQGSIFDKINPFTKQKMYKRIYLYDSEKDNISDQIEEEIEDVSMISLKKIMPLVQNAEINISEGKMTWTGDDGIVYADLYKDNLSSRYGKIE